MCVQSLNAKLQIAVSTFTNALEINACFSAAFLAYIGGLTAV